MNALILLLPTVIRNKGISKTSIPFLLSFSPLHSILWVFSIAFFEQIQLQHVSPPMYTGICMCECVSRSQAYAATLHPSRFLSMFLCRALSLSLHVSMFIDSVVGMLKATDASSFGTGLRSLHPPPPLLFFTLFHLLVLSLFLCRPLSSLYLCKRNVA